jgi:hypothetical protein
LIADILITIRIFFLKIRLSAILSSPTKELDRRDSKKLRDEKRSSEMRSSWRDWTISSVLTKSEVITGYYSCIELIINGTIIVHDFKKEVRDSFHVSEKM